MPYGGEIWYHICRDAEAKFLVEAVTLVARRPHEFHALLSELCPSNSALQASFLAAAALRQAFRVLASAKASAGSKRRIVQYVAGAISLRSLVSICWSLLGYTAVQNSSY